MGYIRSNEEYYESLGYSVKEAEIQAELDRHNIDYGFCNPRKAKEVAEQEVEIRKDIEDKS